METQAARSTHPILIIAGVAVTVFSLVGVAAIMGWIPSSKGQSDPAAAITTPATPAVAQAPETPAPPAPVAEKPRPAPHVAKKAAPKHHEQVARNEPASVPPPPPPAPVVAAICRECGTIEGIHEVVQAGKGSGGGAIAGGIVGGVAGHQTGNGRGRDLMTVLGAVGGALAGNAIEKKATETKAWEILVKFEDGNTRIIKTATQPAWRSGDKVKVINGVIQSNG